MEAFKPGISVKEKDYYAFVPSPVNRGWNFNDTVLSNALSKADQALGRLDAFSQIINIDLYVRMHMTKEAVLSSKIEGTRTNIEEALLDEVSITRERRDDWEEVQNYIKAMREALHLLPELPFSTRYIRRIHQLLMQGVRGQYKQPGEFRRSQNWIGGSRPDNAHFVPPPHREVDRLMGDLEQFVHNARYPMPDLLKAAIMHYQFETIHPFLDGNGRVGRLLITSFLVDSGSLQAPVLYLSAFLENHRSEYYDQLSSVRKSGTLKNWLLFFLEGVRETAGQGVRTFRAITQLRQDMPDRLRPLGVRAANGLRLVDNLYQQPIIRVVDAVEVLGTTNSTAYRLISDLVQLGVLNPIPAPGRGQYYAFTEYIDLFR